MSKRIKYEDYKVIQDLKRQGFNKNQTYLKTKIRKPTILKYWNVSEEEYHKLSYDKAQDIEQYKEFLTRKEVEMHQRKKSGMQIDRKKTLFVEWT